MLFQEPKVWVVYCKYIFNLGYRGNGAGTRDARYLSDRSFISPIMENLYFQLLADNEILTDK